MQSIFFNHNEMKLGSTATEELDKSQICENKQHLLKQPVAQKRNHNRNQKTHKDVKQERKLTKYQTYVWDTVKVVLRRKFITRNAHIKK